MNKSFKEYWTNNMTQFYDDSWGHENYDHQKVQSFMPAEQDKWKINSADKYYIPDKRKRPFCTKCKERGHFTTNCFQTKYTKKCSVCGLDGHFFYKCPNAICTTCRSATKYHTTSCYNCNNFKLLKCSLCRSTGHELQFCPDLWRRYHQTINDTNELSKSLKPFKEESKIWCSNCAKQGHYVEKCTYPRNDRILSTSRIFSYESVYNKDINLKQLCLINEKTEINTNDNNNIDIQKTNNLRKNHIKTFDDSFKKYKNILEKLKKSCSKSDFDSLDLINRYLHDIENKRLSRTKFKKIRKLRRKILNNK